MVTSRQHAGEAANGEEAEHRYAPAAITIELVGSVSRLVLEDEPIARVERTLLHLR